MPTMPAANAVTTALNVGSPYLFFKKNVGDEESVKVASKNSGQKWSSVIGELLDQSFIYCYDVLR